MGVPKFYRWISERYPCLSEVVRDEQIPEFDNLYLDMNGIIHGCSHPDDEDVSFRISEEQIFHDIFNYIDFLFGIIKPKKVFFMAIDGVAPRAKMNQQRARRFMSAKNAQEALSKARKKGIKIPDEKPFDSNCITPGTEFMARLHENLQCFVQMKIATDSCWQGLRIYLSGHNCPGEGEHKIMDFIRSERSRPDYDANTRHCLYGLDADLIMLGICSHEPHFALLREEVKFGRQKFRIRKHRAKVDEITFHLLHLSLLREYLSWEFHSLKEKLPFDYNLESVIDDWILMGFLIGNDFIPHLPHVHIHEDALPLLYATYNEVLPQLDGYINEAGVLNLKRFQIFLKNFAKNDKKNFLEQMDDEAYLSSKRTSNAWKKDAFTSNNDEQSFNEDLEVFDLSNDETNKVTDIGITKGAFDSDSNASDECEEITDQRTLTSTKAVSHGYFGLDKDSDDDLPVASLDDESYENDCDLSWTAVVNKAFKNHKRDYYNDKMKYNNISKEELREQAEGYIRAIQWNLHYYYHGCCSWSWFYPHHYAPYISDVSDFAEMEMNFDLNEPFKPFEQLLAVLPAASADCLPPPYRELMNDPKSPIIDFYPEQFDTDLNGKKNDWEAVILIPFINEDRLLQAVAVKDSLLTDEERQRNMHGPHLLFSYDPSSSHILKSTFPGIFPDIQDCAVKIEKIEMNQFRIPRNRIVHGLLPGVKLDVVFPGFPTLKRIPHIAELLFADIKLFQQPSKNQSMILKIGNRPELEKDIMEIASDLIGKEVHVNWPMLQAALVQELWTAHEKYSKAADEKIICNALSEQEQNMYKTYVNITRRNEFERRGIDAGQQKGLALVRLAHGLRKYFEEQKVLIKRFYADINNTIPVSLSLLVQNAQEDWDSKCALEDLYPINAKVFISSVESKYYGFSGFIKENHLMTKGTLTVSCKLSPVADLNFCDIVADYDNYALKWYTAYELAKFLHTSVDVINRITGCVYVLLDESNVIPSKNTPLKANIGLELKFTKRNQIIPDFTCRSSEGHLLYSSKAFDIIRNYKMKYPSVFNYLEKLDNFQPYIHIKQIFPEFEREELNKKIEELKTFLNTITPKNALESADDVFVDSGVLKEIEKRIQVVISKNTPDRTCKRLAVKPRAIFMAELCKGDSMPDERAEFCLLDRVICVKKRRRAPFGEFGTVIGLLNTNSGKKIDVLFDKPYFGGQIMRSSKASAARLPISSLINITYGKRMRNEIPSIEHIVNSAKTNYKPMDFPKNLQINKDDQQGPSGSSGCIYRNKISMPGDNASSSRNKCKSRNSQASCSNDLWYGERSKIEKESSAAVTHDAELAAKDCRTTVVLVGNRKLQVRPTSGFIDNHPSGSKPQSSEEKEGKIFEKKSSNKSVARRSGKIRDDINFGKMEANSKIIKNNGTVGISSCNFGGTTTIGGTTTSYGDDKGMKNYHGYPRTWFGCSSTRSKDYLRCSHEKVYKEQSNCKSTTRIQKRMPLEKKNNKIASPQITLLKRNKPQDMPGVVSATDTKQAEEFEKNVKSGNEKQEMIASGGGNSPIEQLTEQLNKQHLHTLGESSNLDRLTQSSKSTSEGEILLQKSDQMNDAQTTTIKSTAIDATMETNKHEMNLNDSNYSTVNMPTTTSSSLDICVGKANRRKCRKSRVVANLGYNNNK